MGRNDVGWVGRIEFGWERWRLGRKDKGWVGMMENG